MLQGKLNATKAAMFSFIRDPFPAPELFLSCLRQKSEVAGLPGEERLLLWSYSILAANVASGYTCHSHAATCRCDRSSSAGSFCPSHLALDPSLPPPPKSHTCWEASQFTTWARQDAEQMAAWERGSWCVPFPWMNTALLAACTSF